MSQSQDLAAGSQETDQGASMDEQHIAYHEMDLEKDEPSSRWQEKAERELRETPERKKEALQELRDLIRAEKDLVCRTDDSFLIRFLRPCKFYPESAFNMLRTYFKHMEKHRKVYAEISPFKKTEIIDDGLVLVSPVRDHEGRRIIYVNYGAWDSRKYTLDDMYRYVIMMMELGANEPVTQINGGVCILDLKGMSLSQVLCLTPSFAKRSVDVMQGSFPTRIKGYHVVNQSTLFNMAYNIFKPFLSDKLKSRIHLHGTNFEALHKFVPRYCLTDVLRGTLPSKDSTRLIHVLQENSKIYDDLQIYGYRNTKNK